MERIAVVGYKIAEDNIDSIINELVEVAIKNFEGKSITVKMPFKFFNLIKTKYNIPFYMKSAEYNGITIAETDVEAVYIESEDDLIVGYVDDDNIKRYLDDCNSGNSKRYYNYTEAQWQIVVEQYNKDVIEHNEKLINKVLNKIGLTREEFSFLKNNI